MDLSLSRWRTYRRTVRDLNDRSDRELRDMGIPRWRVRDVAAGKTVDPKELV